MCNLSTRTPVTYQPSLYIPAGEGTFSPQQGLCKGLLSRERELWPAESDSCTFTQFM